jgi:hypothetical protein
LAGDDGKVGMIHPMTFMYIKTFEDVRKFILDKTHIDLLSELGLGGVFANSDVQADVVMYILSKESSDTDGIYFDLKKYKNHTNKPQIFETIYEHYLKNLEDKHISKLQQVKLKAINSQPFIYWISDDLRHKFGKNSLEKNAKVAYGVKTGNNDELLRHWWEIQYSKNEKIKWVLYTKGGPYNKWFGNNWLCVNWENDGEAIKKQRSYSLPPKGFYFKEGICFPDASSKGICFRYLPDYILYDKGSSAIFSKYNNYVTLGILNSKLVFYIANCLNPTVSKMPNDIKRIPLIVPKGNKEQLISKLVEVNVKIK